MIALERRLPASVPEWTRSPAWVSAAARDTWQPRVERIVKMRVEVERRSVAAGLRSACLTFATPAELPATVAAAKALGLSVQVISLEAAGSQYTQASRPATGAEPGHWRVALTKPGAICSFESPDAAGRALGYPACCRAAFVARWLDPAKSLTTWLDPTWPTFLASDRDATGPVEANLLLRWIGVRLVPHLPCTFRCEATVAFGQALEVIGREVDAEAIDWAREMLEWPITWDSRSGVLLLSTPLFRLTASTDAMTRARINRPGRQPAGTPTGLTSLFREPDAPAITDSRSFQSSIDVVAAGRNGFASPEAMAAAHAPLVEAVVAALPSTPAPLVLDLGCGDGALLERIRLARPDVRLAGIEVLAERATAAGARLGDADAIREGSIADLELWPNAVDVVILMPGRLTELSAAMRALVVEALRARASAAVCYTYDRWRHVGQLLAETGLSTAWTSSSARIIPLSFAPKDLVR